MGMSAIQLCSFSSRGARPFKSIQVIQHFIWSFDLRGSTIYKSTSPNVIVVCAINKSWRLRG